MIGFALVRILLWKTEVDRRAGRVKILSRYSGAGYALFACRRCTIRVLDVLPEAKAIPIFLGHAELRSALNIDACARPARPSVQYGYHAFDASGQERTRAKSVSGSRERLTMYSPSQVTL